MQPRLHGVVFQVFVTHIIANISGQIENQIFQKRFTEWGALLVDNDVRTLGQFLRSTVKLGNVRELLSRLTQVVSILTVERSVHYRDHRKSDAGLCVCVCVYVCVDFEVKVLF